MHHATTDFAADDLGMYEYRAELIRIVDADTIEVRIDLGLDSERKISLRLAGIDAPERFTAAGKMATARLAELLGTKPFVIRTIKDRTEKYGRYLASIFVDDVNINDAMVEEGHAVARWTT
jgi:micrococcal nuclease